MFRIIDEEYMKEATEYFKSRRYPGRGILFGVSSDGSAGIAVYFIMGRSSNSRNRIFAQTEEGVVTRPYDAALVRDPSLILYAPVRRCGDALIVTNGDQTDTIYDYLVNGGSFRSALLTRCYEPDAPHFTPRISGIFRLQGGTPLYTLSILRKKADSMDCARDFYEYPAPTPGCGHLIHTYEENVDPLVPFAGAPKEIKLPEGTIDAVAQSLWDSLDAENRISLYVGFFPLSGGNPVIKIHNRHLT